MLKWHPNERLSAQECLDDPVLKMLQSEAIAVAEEHLTPVHIDPEHVSSLAPGSFDSSQSFDSRVSEYSPGVEEAVAWRDQEENGSRTAMPPHPRSRTNNPQPIPHGLVWVGNSGNGPENQQDVEVEEPTAKLYQKSKTGPIASSKWKVPEIQHEVEVEELTAKTYHKSIAGAIARPRRNLQPDKQPAFSPTGLSVAGPHRTPSQLQRNGSLVSKRSTSSSVARHRRGSSTSGSVSETTAAAAHALMDLKKHTR